MCTTLLAPPAANCALARGCGDATVPEFPVDAAALARNHPCYSEEAHHHFARLHLPVAPVCNIQCHYCNRKYDCSNESRPGVVSKKLSPGEAVEKVLFVARKMPELAVVGIAGPGDALANPDSTFETLEGIRRVAPDLTLCLSTNGLALPEQVDRLVGLGVRHVTVTVNMIDPKIGAQIYPFIVWEGRKVRGEEASRILSSRQLEGIEALAKKGVLVKVNSVLIPGVNDRHLSTVVREVRRRGAFLVNVMPLISEAAHGTHYGLTGQRGPDPRELEAVQRACEIDARMMRHCRKCRADAVGRLGDDRFVDFAKIPAAVDRADDGQGAREERRTAVEEARTRTAIALRSSLARVAEIPTTTAARVAVATKGTGRVDEHFGHAKEFLVYDVDRRGVVLVGTRRVDSYCRGGEGDDEALGATLRALDGCQAVLVAKIGRCPSSQLVALGVEPVTEQAFQPVELAILDWFAGHADRAIDSPPKENLPEVA